jgi:hypothetical protein
MLPKPGGELGDVVNVVQRPQSPDLCLRRGTARRHQLGPARLVERGQGKSRPVRDRQQAKPARQFAPSQPSEALLKQPDIFPAEQWTPGKLSGELLVDAQVFQARLLLAAVDLVTERLGRDPNDYKLFGPNTQRQPITSIAFSA